LKFQRKAKADPSSAEKRLTRDDNVGTACRAPTEKTKSRRDALRQAQDKPALRKHLEGGEGEEDVGEVVGVVGDEVVGGGEEGDGVAVGADGGDEAVAVGLRRSGAEGHAREDGSCGAGSGDVRCQTEAGLADEDVFDAAGGVGAEIGGFRGEGDERSDGGRGGNAGALADAGVLAEPVAGRGAVGR